MKKIIFILFVFFTVNSFAQSTNLPPNLINKDNLFEEAFASNYNSFDPVISKKLVSGTWIQDELKVKINNEVVFSEPTSEPLDQGGSDLFLTISEDFTGKSVKISAPRNTDHDFNNVIASQTVSIQKSNEDKSILNIENTQCHVATEDQINSGWMICIKEEDNNLHAVSYRKIK